MREIKFRAWDKKEKSWLCTDMEYQECFAVQNSQAVKSGMAEVEGWLQPIYDVEIMQFTGLRDRNGKEIYEGDIVCTEYNPGNHENCHKQFHDVVEYKDGTYSTFNPANGYEYGSDPNECEVLGNIYENQELVQSK